MAMKLPTLPTHGPMRGVPRASGSLLTLTLRSLASPLGESTSEVDERSAPGFATIVRELAQRAGLVSEVHADRA